MSGSNITIPNLIKSWYIFKISRILDKLLGKLKLYKLCCHKIVIILGF